MFSQRPCGQRLCFDTRYKTTAILSATTDNTYKIQYNTKAHLILSSRLSTDSTGSNCYVICEQDKVVRPCGSDMTKHKANTKFAQLPTLSNVNFGCWKKIIREVYYIYSSLLSDSNKDNQQQY